MGRFFIILENPKYSGNIGMVCRLIANFALPPLRIIGQKKEFDFEMQWMASHSCQELEKIQYFRNIETCRGDLALLIGTAMITGRDRGPYLTLPELPSLLTHHSQNIGLLFGREDKGLQVDTINRCDYLIDFKLPGSQPSMNVSHAVVYTLSIIQNYPLNIHTKEQATNSDKQQFYRYSERIFKLLEMDNYHTKKNLAVKRLKGILDSRPLSSGDLGFFYKMFRNIENFLKRKK
ncbi:MAG: TrmH family RNA methyltransferase [Spirochaetota bacterium]